MTQLIALTSGPQIRDCVKEILSSSPHAYIASPYWTKGTLDALGFGTGPLNGKLSVLCDLRSGACDPHAIRDMLDRGASVISIDRLHAKVYIGNGGVVVGSANATAPGLWHGSSTNFGNHEAAMLATSGAVRKSWLTWWGTLAAGGIDLSNKQIADLLLDIADQEIAANQPTAPSLIDVLLDGSYKKSSVPLYVTIDWIDADKEVKAKASDLSKMLNRTIGYWQDWPEMPGRAQIISLMLWEDGSIELEDAWRTPVNPKSEMDPSTKAIYVSKVERIDGRYKLDKTDQWSLAARKYTDDPAHRRHFSGKGTGACLTIDEFLLYLKLADREHRK